MSGSTIGGVIGGVIGAYFGNAQLGWMIGSAIGGYVDPTVIKGPRLSDSSRQTAQDGVPIPFGFGTFPTAGNIIWSDKLREHKQKKRQGKGGPVQETFVYTRSYAIGICEGLIEGLLLIKRNGKIVYDVRDATALGQTYATSGGALLKLVAMTAAANNSFITKCTIYTGDESQLPDSTIEAIEGVGNVGPNRGLAYVVVKGDDLTETQGAIPQYEFVVSVAGVTTAVTSTSYAAGEYGRFIDATFPLLDSEDHYTFSGVRGFSAPFTAPTLAEVLAHFSDYYGPVRSPDTYLGYFARTSVGPGDVFSAHVTQDSVVQSESLILVYNELSGTNLTTANASDLCIVIPRPADGSNSETYMDRIGNIVYMEHDGVPGTSSGGSIYNNCTNYSPYNAYFPSVVGFQPVSITVTRKRAAPAAGVPAGYEAVPDSPGYYVNSAGDVVRGQSYALVTGTFKELATPAPATTSVAGLQRTHWEVGPVLASTDPNYSSSSFWTSAYTSAVGSGKLPAGLVYGTDYPVAVTSVYQGSSVASSTLAPSAVTLGAIVASLCAREGLDATQYDTSGLTDAVLGYKVAVEAGADSMIGPLMQAYFFDVGEWDGRLHFIKRGGAAAFSITAADLGERDAEALTLERVQEAELLRKVTVGYLDPMTVYTATTQAWERRSGTVEAKGEASVEIPLVCTSLTAAQIAEKRGKVAWSETEKAHFNLPALKWARLTPTDAGTLTTADGTVLRLRVMSREEDSGMLTLECSRDRQAAYAGSALGVAPKPPSLPTPGLIGPTRLAVMDLPVLSEADDALGAYVAVSGILGGWRGATVQFSTDDGATASTLVTITSPATMGMTTTDLSAWTSAEYPSTQSVTVSLKDPPESVSYDALLRYANRAAVQLGSGAWEVLQYQTVTTNGDGTYTLSGLVRGRYDTTPGTIPAGARFVLLDAAVQFVPIESWALNTPLKVRVVSAGTDPDAASWSDILITGRSQIEWAPVSVQAVRDGSNNVAVSWVGRGRIGPETAPRNSLQFAGYRVTFSDGVTATTSASAYTRSSTPAGVTVTVAALNSITGAGPSSETVST